MNYHDWLYRTRRLMAEVEAAMSEMAGHIETDDALPNLFYSGESDARTIIHKMPELRHKLRQAFYRIGDNLPDIPGNPFLTRETTTHVKNYRQLRTSFKLLFYGLDRNPDAKEFLFSDKMDWDSLLAYFKELDDDARDSLLAYASPPDVNDCRAVDVTGMAKKLRQFLPDTDDEFFDDLINFRIIPARPISWHNGKNNCARFLKHFGFTDAMANRIFCCVQDGRPLGKIKISSDAGQKADTAQGIEAILKEYPFDASSVRPK